MTGNDRTGPQIAVDSVGLDPCQRRVRVLGRVRQRLRDDVVGRHLDRFGQAVLCSHVTITPSQDGPYIVSGPARLVAPDGHEIEHPDPVSICRCGGSSNKSFCDGTHATIDCDGTLAH